DIAIALDANNALLYNNRAFTHVALKNYPQAIADYNRAIDYDTDNALLYQNRGLAKMNIGEYAGALHDYEQASALDNSLAGIERNLRDARAALRWQNA
ncbi:MAG: tetratricopeptide repeat protein, partial [Aggregatilineales bacterium]